MLPTINILISVFIFFLLLYMSLNENKLAVIEVIDPLLDLHEHRTYGAYDGGSEITYRRYDSQASINQTQSTIIANPPNDTTVIHPQVYIGAPITVAFTGNAGAGKTLFASSYGVTDAPRWMPINNITGTLTATINNNTVTTSLNEYLSAFIRYNNEIPNFDREFSTTPSMLDQFQVYDDGIGSARNPLANYLDNSAQCPRGGFPVVVNSDTQFAANVTFYSIEPLLISPFYYSIHQAAGHLGQLVFGLVGRTVALGQLMNMNIFEVAVRLETGGRDAERVLVHPDGAVLGVRDDGNGWEINDRLNVPGAVDADKSVGDRAILLQGL